jgi:hypothetical protein
MLHKKVIYRWSAPITARLLAWALRWPLPPTINLHASFAGRLGGPVTFAEAWHGRVYCPGRQ